MPAGLSQRTRGPMRGNLIVIHLLSAGNQGGVEDLRKSSSKAAIAAPWSAPSRSANSFLYTSKVSLMLLCPIAVWTRFGDHPDR